MNRIRKSPRCFECLLYLIDSNNSEPEMNEVKSLKKCDKCKVVSYCSKNCENRNKISHKNCCDFISGLQSEIRKIDDEMDFNDIKSFKTYDLSGYDIARHQLCDVMGNTKNCLKYTLYDTSKEFQDYVWKKQSIAFAIWHLAGMN